MSPKRDVILVGSGTAGLSALREVRRKTDDFLLINEGSWGTTCAAVGCMPSKALIEAAKAFHRRVDFTAFGLRGGDGVTADIPAVLARVRRLRNEFVKAPESVRDELGDRAISGRARLVGPDRVAVNGQEISANRIILAPGSRPIVPKDWQQFDERILTTDTIFDQTDLPRRIAVVGLGPVGVELAQALSHLGLDVAGFDAAECVAGISDPEIARSAAEILSRDIALHLGKSAELSDSGAEIVVSGAGASFTADAVLAAIGRKPNIDGLGLENLGAPLDDDGMPDVDPTTLQIGDLPVWLAGDGNGRLPLLHEAADEGFIAGRNAMEDLSVRYRRRTELAIVFSSPGIASVGQRFGDLDAEKVAIGKVDFSRQARARMAERADGAMRVYAERESGRLIGAEMCAPAAEHLAHLLALAVETKLTVHEMLAMPFYHPVLEEGLRTALRDLARKIPIEDRSDLAQCPAFGIDALD